MNIIKENIKDILQSDGKNKNFLTNLPYGQDFKELAKKWSKLPLYSDNKKIQEFFKHIDENQVLLIISGTGSGKTVLVPKLLLRYFIAKESNKKISITNPKIITTIENATYSAKCLDVKLGHEVGYAYAGSPPDSNSRFTKLLYNTDGLLLSTILGGDKYLSEYDGVVIDEAHERAINIDLLLGLIKDILKHRPEFKLIIMSATIDMEIFKEYYIKDKIKFANMMVSGEPNYPIAHNWLDSNMKVNEWNYVDKTVDICIKILDSSDSGDIIVFVPGTKDAIKGCKLLKEQCPTKIKIKKEVCSSIYCVEVFSGIDDEQKQLAVSKDMYKKNIKLNRKVIFATNVAESSITFDGLVYVIDTGYEYHSFYDSHINARAMKRIYTSQAQIKQRIGRTGRTANGIAYHLYTEKQFKEFKPYPDPGILSTELTDTILQMIQYSKTISNVISIISNMITPPNIKQVINALYKLYFIDLIKMVNKDDKMIDINDINYDKIKTWKDFENINGAITTVGHMVLKFKTTYSPILSIYSIIMSHYMKCSGEVIKIMAIIDTINCQLDRLFSYKQNEEETVKMHFKEAIVRNSDHITLLNIYNNYYLHNKTKYLDVKTWDKIKLKINDISDICNKLNDNMFDSIKEKYIQINIKSFKEINDNIYYVLALSHYFNLIKKVGETYETQHFLNNSVAKCDIMKLYNKTEVNEEYAICYELSDFNTKKLFKGITHINKTIINKIIK
jgi:pre-mRNA-splicing factor ATP-dependent RNA helicase DHX15/PRP43